MLKTRLITALLLAPPILVLLFFGPRWGFELLLALVFIAAAWEWATLMACITRAGRVAYTALVIALIAAFAALKEAVPELLPVLLAVAIVWWAFVFGWLAFRPERSPSHSPCAWKGLCGVLTLLPAFAAIDALHYAERGHWLLLYLLALVWLADVGAYFAGRAFGSRKLAPRVSPGKTWEGVAGAFAAALVVTGAGVVGGIAFGPVWFFVALSVLVVAASIVGDLAESMFKRQCGIKDSGTLLPGHGGMLDRIDSLTAAAPLFVGGMIVADVAF